MSPLFFSSYLPSPSGQTAVNEILVRSRHSFVRWQCHLPPPSLSHRVVRPLCFFLSSLLLSSSLVLLPVFFSNPSVQLSLSLSLSCYLSISNHRLPRTSVPLLRHERGWPQSSGVWRAGVTGFAYVVTRRVGGWNGVVCSQITLSYARTCSHGSSTPHRVCHPAWENVFIVVCPAFCIWPPTEWERERAALSREGGREREDSWE